MMKIFRFLFCCMVAVLTLSCNKADQPEFNILGEKEFSVERTGNVISVIMQTNQDYKVTAEHNWCIVALKQPIEFKIKVLENPLLEKRSNKITIESRGFEPITLTINQEAGVPFFRIDDAELTKDFGQEGGKKIVTISTNSSDYTVTSDSDWCTTENLTNEAFTINAAENTKFKRTAKLTIKAAGLEEDVVITVNQKGVPFIKDPYLINGLAEWTLVPENRFTIGGWIPEGKPAGTDAVRVNDDPEYFKLNEPFRMFKEINDIPDGKYLFSCIIANSPAVDKCELALLFVDAEGNETKQTVPGGLAHERFSMEVEVKGGKCKVGLYACLGIQYDFWFNCTDFRLE